ncbi:MAG: pantoate--beta-alanine ligase [Kordiimonadaceae bacterium]|nr:pantoate--beta-alanine ligase [Kordiimonadaceae bacterium]
MNIVRTIAELRDQVALWRADGHSIGLVPTMGALHKGHLSLVDEISANASKIIVSIFVNPTQFAENEDLDAYPRQEANDCKKLEASAASLVFAPSENEMYGTGHKTRVTLDGISEILEGASRPGHFDGVATIVSKLLLQCMPDIAIFGEKDYQQLAVIRQIVRDLNIPVKILGGTLVREDDGLAYSSRNAYLNPLERKIAGHFNLILAKLVEAAPASNDLRALEDQATNELLKAGFTSVDYVQIVDKTSLRTLAALSGPARVVAVARLGAIRLLDNMEIQS